LLSVRRKLARWMQMPAGMIDLVYVLATFAFFAVAWAYARACDRI
jgi:hypothetical protein